MTEKVNETGPQLFGSVLKSRDAEALDHPESRRATPRRVAETLPPLLILIPRTV